MKAETKKRILQLLSQGHQQHCWLRSGAQTGTCTCVIGQVEALLSENESFNINDKVKVELTEVGRQMFRAHMSAVLHFFPTPPRQEVVDVYKKQEESGEFHLHELMNIFGAGCFMSAPQLFKDNQIRIDQ
jgi:hypothetical protein